MADPYPLEGVRILNTTRGLHEAYREEYFRAALAQALFQDTEVSPEALKLYQESLRERVKRYEEE